MNITYISISCLLLVLDFKEKINQTFNSYYLEMKEKKKTDYITRPDIPQVRTYRDYKDNKRHRIWFDSKWIIKEEILEEEDTYLHS